MEFDKKAKKNMKRHTFWENLIDSAMELFIEMIFDAAF